ncbi:MAG TPA: hypothetical protein VG826_32505 [Pirellulales bacterium]|nr:hypothetical protein [Pirellulales bacterium]
MSDLIAHDPAGSAGRASDSSSAAPPETTTSRAPGKTAAEPRLDRPVYLPAGAPQAVLVACLLAAHASAQLPRARLHSVFPAGARQGTTIEVTITGADLDGADRLRFTHTGITAEPIRLASGEVEVQPQPTEGKFRVAIAGDVPPGTYEVRVAGQYGLSNPRFFVVDSRPEVGETEPNSRPDQANEVACGGIVNGIANGGADRDFFKFAAQKGQRLLIDCQARRIDSRLDPMLVLYDTQGRELASAHDGGHRDTLLDYTVAADGQYLVEVRDFIYEGGADHGYRLAICAGPHVDFIFPPAGPPGTNQVYQLYGRNLPGGASAPGLTVEGRPLEAVSVSIELPADADDRPAGALVEPAGAGIDAVLYRFPSPQGLSNSVPIGLATAPVVFEQEPNDVPQKAQPISPPCDVAGQFYPIADHDWFTFEANKGDSYVIEVVSQRLGALADPCLVVEQVMLDKEGNEQVKELQRADDTSLNAGGVDFDTVHDDPSFRFKAPDDGRYRVLVRDLHSSTRGDPRFVYQLTVRAEQPDFRLVAFSKFPGAQPNRKQSLVWSPNLVKGASDEVEVIAFRRDGFDGEIVVTAQGLPEGVSAPAVTIGPGRHSATLVLSASEAAADAVAPLCIVGEAKIGAGQVTHAARAASIVWPGQPGQFDARSRLSADLLLAVSARESALFSLQADEHKVWEVSRGGRLEIPVSLTQRGDFTGTVTLSAVDLPPGIRPAQRQMDAGPGETKFTIDLPPNAPLGTFSFHLLGTSQYTSPQSLEAGKRLKELEEMVASSKAALRAANQTKIAAEQASQQATAEAKRLEQAWQASTKKVVKVRSAKKRAFARAAERAKLAADGKLAAEAAVTEADAGLKRALQTLQAARNQATPRKVNVGYPSPPITIRITATPLKGVAPATLGGS